MGSLRWLTRARRAGRCAGPRRDRLRMAGPWRSRPARNRSVGSLDAGRRTGRRLRGRGLARGRAGRGRLPGRTRRLRRTRTAGGLRASAPASQAGIVCRLAGRIRQANLRCTKLVEQSPPVGNPTAGPNLADLRHGDVGRLRNSPGIALERCKAEKAVVIQRPTRVIDTKPLSIWVKGFRHCTPQAGYCSR